MLKAILVLYLYIQPLSPSTAIVSVWMVGSFFCSSRLMPAMAYDAVKAATYGASVGHIWLRSTTKKLLKPTWHFTTSAIVRHSARQLLSGSKALFPPNINIACTSRASRCPQAQSPGCGCVCPVPLDVWTCLTRHLRAPQSTCVEYCDAYCEASCSCLLNNKNELCSYSDHSIGVEIVAQSLN